ncbi:hypothetical protein INS49_013319 [Diaporthe citri]|uniref:uncharacterized protein n=1 Tax=Diaporthe citri TaxID=83186 RepID=UPI001C80F8E7|nr:uncharacterized protein INS49_013319 [Diaporthe citri]KAG6357442.1 hypothetical protein INS49_013319 [Diaporthe citri]
MATTTDGLLLDPRVTAGDGPLRVLDAGTWLRSLVPPFQRVGRVDFLAAECEHRLPAPQRLGGAGPRLDVLAGDAAHLYDRHTASRASSDMWPRTLSCVASLKLSAQPPALDDKGPAQVVCSTNQSARSENANDKCSQK